MFFTCLPRKEYNKRAPIFIGTTITDFLMIDSLDTSDSEHASHS